jgi:hypothetical protein
MLSSMKIRVIAASALLCTVPLIAAAQEYSTSTSRAPKAEVSIPTPRTSDGHPDLTGLWNGRGGGATNQELDATNPDYAKTNANGYEPSILATRGGTFTNFERDSSLMKRMGTNKPMYRPEFWEKVRVLDRNNNDEDPSANNCMPAGVPRTGAPTQIVQTGKELFLMYVPGGASGFAPTFRAIPMDGRKHSNLEDLDGTWNGESIGHWEGDTLVIDSIGFTENTWLDKQGYFHSENMHVIEKLTRNGNSLTWQATVEDPDVLLQPWTMDPITVRLNPNPTAVMPEPAPCSDRDLAHTVTKEHH